MSAKSIPHHRLEVINAAVAAERASRAAACAALEPDTASDADLFDALRAADELARAVGDYLDARRTDAREEAAFALLSAQLGNRPRDTN